ncbi:MAG: hypothetical protein H7250_06650 [Flavobacterium sp.]|nr:hypothetical protein [Flavobacterium sp.]
MKKIIFFFLTIFFVIAGTQNLKAQCPIKLDFLEKAAILSKDKFDTSVLGKGYSLNPIKGDGKSDFVQYWCDTRRPGGALDQVERTAGEGMKTSIGFNTIDKQLYLNFKKDLDKKKYKLIEQKEQSVGELTTTFYYYANENYQVNYHTYYFAKDGTTRYVMNISKI